jgi:hypothetical protein
MDSPRVKSFNYAIGMFGTSIPINMLKTYAAIYYVDRLGLTTLQLSLMLLIYTFIDALDNPIYGFLSDRTRTRWGRRRPWLVIGTPLLVLGLIAFYNTPAFLAGNQCQLRRPFPGAVSRRCQPGIDQCPTAGVSVGGDDYQHCADSCGDWSNRVRSHRDFIWYPGRQRHPVHELFLQRDRHSSG